MRHKETNLLTGVFLLNEEPTDNKALMEILERLAKQQKITISSPEINAAFQGGFREGFLEGFQEGMNAMRYISDTSTTIIKKILDEAAKDISDMDQKIPPKTGSDPQQKNTGSFYS